METMAGPIKSGVPAAPPALRVSAEVSPGNRQEFRFEQAFRIGRVGECGLCILNDYVSRNHAEVAWENGEWIVRDLASRNGIFVDGERKESVAIGQGATIRLGVEGPFVTFAVEQPVRPVPPPLPSGSVGSETIVARYIERYFADRPKDEPVGEHTIMVRQAFSRVQKRQKRKYAWIVGSLALLVIAVGAYAIYQHREASKQKALAQDLFYSMKSLDVDIARFEQLVMDSNNKQGASEIRKYQERRREMQANYDRFLATLRVYDPKISPEDRLILRVARIFGECELAMPPDFISEVKGYIKRWQSSGRLARAIRTAQEHGYTPYITKQLLDQDLPPQFFYLALQESDFDPFISGPTTRKGIAKGMWQFIPETAIKYGLQIGPLVDFRRPDPADDRHHWDRETIAAARYLKDLYSTDAQASGFLVMACYNWGENQVLPLVQSMPANPRERNFWRLLAKYRPKLPKETYDYVFYIVSAAVIGENPKMFGFDFDNPLAHLEAR
jgi:membrane-bound lytic murein transglycosylase D